MDKLSQDDTPPAWLGGEAHVRRQDGRPWWAFPVHWRQSLLLSAAFLAGSAVAGSTAAVIGKSLTRPLPRQEEDNRRMNAKADRHHEYRPVDVLLAFVAGTVIGAGIAFFTAPQSGTEMRRRLVRGARTAQDELTDVVEETRDALEALTKDARQTLRQTATRLTDVLEATKDAMKAETGHPRVPDRHE